VFFINLFILGENFFNTCLTFFVGSIIILPCRLKLVASLYCLFCEGGVGEWRGGKTRREFWFNDCWVGFSLLQ
jgi:hypothetical protein